MRKVNILFRVSGGKAPKKELGYGHIFRSIHLAYFFKKHNIWFLLEDYGGAKNILKHHGFDNVLKLKKNSSLDSDIERTINVIKNKKIDVMINDTYKASEKYLKKVKKFTKTVLITDLKQSKYSSDITVNGFIGFKNQKIIHNDGGISLLGPKYQILNHRFSSKNSETKYDLLVTFGGFDENNITEIFLEQLIKFPGTIKTKIIHGPSSEKTARIKEIEREFPGYFSLIAVGDMYKEISNTKFGLCSGGITTYEFATLGIPFAIISQVKHQTTTAKIWEKNKIATDLGIVDRNTGKKISKYLGKIYSMRQKRNRIYHIDLDGNGGKRVHKEIMKFLE